VSEIADAQVVDAADELVPAGTALAVREQPGLAVTPAVTAEDLVARLEVIKDAARTAMTENVDYGKVPGTDKDTLLKPGAEKLGVLFQLDIQLDNEKVWGPGDHLTVLSHATVFHAPTGSRLGYGEGVCSTREKKYARRKADRVCPNCGKTAIIKGKAEYGGGWVCFKKKDGCGSKFAEDDPQIVAQPAGEVENPDLPDVWNTVVKMAEKRARVDAVLAVTGASALFTQDAEDSLSPSETAQEPVTVPSEHGRVISKEATPFASRALTRILGGDQDLARKTWGEIKEKCGGIMPQDVGAALVVVANAAVTPIDPEPPEVQ
jgi:ribosomal protein L37AE/L43A